MPTATAETMQGFLDDLVAQYKTPAYILNDPIQIPHRYLDDPRACEVMGFIAALFSYGRRDVIIDTLHGLCRILGPDPVGFIEGFNPRRDARLFKHFVYRFNKGRDVVFLLSRLQWVLHEYGSLEALFMQSPALGHEDLKQATADFMDALLGEEPFGYLRGKVPVCSSGPGRGLQAVPHVSALDGAPG